MKRLLAMMALAPTVAFAIEVSTVAELTNAVANAKAGDTITLKTGTYTFDSEFYDVVNGATNLLRVKVGNLTIEGEDSSSRSTWSDQDEPVIIDANGKGRVFYFNKVEGVTIRNIAFTRANTRSGSNTANKKGGAGWNNGTIDDVVFTNCVFRSIVDGECGAGFNVTLRDCLVTNCSNTASTWNYAFQGKAYNCDFMANIQGAIYETEAYNCRFVGSYRSGGGAVGAGNNQIISNCHIEASSGFAAFDGGKFFDCVFTNNTGTTCGCLYRPALVKRCGFYDNLAINNSKGGAILATKSPFCIVEDSVFVRNAAKSGGAIYLQISKDATGAIESPIVTVSNCTFVGNAATESGGAIAFLSNLTDDCIPTNYLTVAGDSRFLCNVATNCGGAVYTCVKGGFTATVTNCTFEGNGCLAVANWGYGGAGGAVYQDVPNGGKRVLLLDDSTFRSNFACNAAGVCYADAVRCRFSGNERMSDLSKSKYHGCDATLSYLDECDITTGELYDCVVNRCTIHDVSENVLSIFSEYVRATNTLVAFCCQSDTERSMYHCEKNLDAEFVNCTFVTNKMNTYSIFANPTTTNAVRFVNCLFNGNWNARRVSDFTTTGRGGWGLWSKFAFENTYYGRFAEDTSYNLTDAMFATKTGEGALMLCENPKFAGRDAVVVSKFPQEPFWALSYKSPLLGKGSLLDWPEGATDLAGRPRVRDGNTDVGCYQCWLDKPGFIMILQ